MFKNVKIAVVGATGNVGRCMLSILEEKGFPIENITAVASERSIGKEVSYGERKTLKVEGLDNFDFSKINYALFSPGSKVSAVYAPKAAAAGCVVIDNTSYFRMEANVPLIVPEVNPEYLKNHLKSNLIANPNCVVAQIVMAIKPLHDLSPIKRLVITTLQSVSGAGKAAMMELDQQTKAIYFNKNISANEFEKQIAFNLIPKIGNLFGDGYTDEEQKIIYEIKKILSPSIEVTATCVRAPVFIGHSATINIEFDQPVKLDHAVKAMKKFSGLIVKNQTNDFISPIECVGEDFVYVSRIRKDYSCKNGINLWVVADNLRKGAALNAVQILQLLIK